MSHLVFKAFIQRYLTDSLHNIRNSMINTALAYQGHIDTIKPIAKRLESTNTIPLAGAAHTSFEDVFADWEARKPLLLDPSRHGDGEGLVHIIDGYIGAVEGASQDSDDALDNLAYNAHFTKNCVRRMLGLTDQYGDDEFTHLDAGMPTVVIGAVVDGGSGAFGDIAIYLNKHVYIPSEPPPGTPAPPSDVHNQHEADYVGYEKQALALARSWADTIRGHQMGFIGRLRNVDTYRQRHTINRNALDSQETQADIYTDIAKQYHDQTLVNVATGQTDAKAHPAIKIETIRYDDGSTGIVVELAGIDNSEGYPGANVLPGGIFAGAGWGYLTDYYRDAKQAISDYCKRMGYNENTIPMTFEGHSLGGIISQQLADTSGGSPSFPPAPPGIQLGDAGQFGSTHNIREVVTMGSPNMLSSYSDNTRVSLYTDMGDVVPLLSTTDALTTVTTFAATSGLLNPFTSPTGRYIDTWGETVVDQGNVPVLNANGLPNAGESHGAYGQSNDLQRISVDFVVPDPKSTYYYTAPVGTNTPQQAYTAPSS